MILETILILILVWSFINGYRQGLLNTLARLIGYAFLAVIAMLLAHPLGTIITNFITSTSTTYRPNVPSVLLNRGSQFLGSGLAFIIIYAIGGYVIHTLLGGLKFIKKIPVVSTFNAILGGMINLVFTYIILFFILQFLSVLNIEWLHQQFLQAPIIETLLDKTPIISNEIYQWWLKQSF